MSSQGLLDCVLLLLLLLACCLLLLLLAKMCCSPLDPKKGCKTWTWSSPLSSMFCLAALQRRPVQYHSRWLLIVLWLSVHLGQLAPTTLPQCRLVSNSHSAGLSLSLAFCSVGLSLSLCVSPSLSLSVSRPLHPPKGFYLSPHPPQGGFLPSHPPHPFSLSLSPQSLCFVLPPPPLLAGSFQAYRRSHGGVLSNV